MSAIESTFKPRFPIETRLFINNEYVDAVSGEPTIDLVNPATGQQVAKVQVAGKEDVDRAVDAAQAAFPGQRPSPLSQCTFVALTRLR